MHPRSKQPRFIRVLKVFSRRTLRWFSNLAQDANPPPDTLKNILYQSGGAAARYVRDIRWGYQKPGFDMIRAVWKLGWPGRIGIMALALSTIGSAMGMTVATSQGNKLETVGIILSLAMFAVGWALALTAAAEYPLWIYGIVSAYLIWYGTLIGGSLAGTVFFALPSLWMLFVSIQIQRESSHRDWIWHLLLCLGTGYLTFSTLGLGHFIAQDWHGTGRLVLGIAYFCLLGLQKRFVRPWPTTQWVFWGTLFVTGGFFALAAWHDSGVTAENTTLSFSGILGLVSFFWLWLGGSFAQDMLGIGEWGANETSRWLGRWARWLIPAVWLSAALFGWLATYQLPLWLTVIIYQAGLYAWVDSWSVAHYFTAHTLPMIGLIVLLAWIAYARLTRWQPADGALAHLNGLWIAVAITLLGFFESMEAFSTLETDAIPKIGFWPILVLLGGLWWDIATSNAEWAKASEQHLKAMLAFIGLMLSISIGLVAAGSTELIMEYTLYSFLGLVYLGLPLSIYTLLQNNERYEPVPGRNLALLFGLGCFSALIALKINPYASLHLIIVPPLWCLVFLVWGKSLGRLQSHLDGAAAGTALAAGFITFWMSPELVPVPFLGFTQDWQMSYLMVPLHRPLLQMGHLWLTLISLGVGISLGWAFAIHQNLAVRLMIIVTSTLAFAWLVPLLPGMPVP